MDLLSVFAQEQVNYLVIGGYAVGYYATPRFTKDLDLLVDSTPDNLARVYGALSSFGAPSHVLESLRNLQPGEVLWMGNPPVRVDILQRVDGVDFKEAFQRREQAKWKSIDVSLISRQDLIASKKAAGRPQDLVDVENLLAGDGEF